jgi:DNA-binding response OmpR family regulator
MDLPDDSHHRHEQLPKAAMLNLLLLEDDPVSRAFLSDVLGTLPAKVDCAESCARAESLARAGAYALWLFDANLPDGNGADLLARLRASDLTTPAVALTAESFPDRLDALSNAGFVEVLQKPIAATALLAAIRNRVAGTGPAESNVTAPTTLWDETRALAAVGGKVESARALRELFLGELPGQVESVLGAFANSDHATVRDHLHRLKASCGFVGANRLLSAVNRLSVGMDPASLQDFLDSAMVQRQSVPITPGAA